eukprot:670456-Pyramimonas_sp.AAC.1
MVGSGAQGVVGALRLSAASCPIPSSSIEIWTRRAIVDAVIDRTARVDRIYCSLPSAILANMTTATSTIGRLRIGMHSDRVHVASNISMYTPDQIECKNIPLWLAKSP